MKKVVSILCVIFFLVGLILVGVGRASGGRYYNYGNKIGNGHYYTTVEDAEGWAEPEDWESYEETEFSESYATSEVTSLQIDMDYGKVDIIPSDELRVEAINSKHVFFETELNDGVLKIKSENFKNIRKKIDWDSIDDGWDNLKVRLYIPEGYEFESAKIAIGVGACYATSLYAQDIKLSLSAGKIELIDAHTTTFTSDVSAGQLEIEGFYADTATLKVAAGEASVEDIQVNTCKGDVSAGRIYLNGEIHEGGEFNCSLGQIELNLAGSRSDYNIKSNTEMGRISIDGETNFGVGNNQFSGVEGDKLLKLSCSTGDIQLYFYE